MTHFFKKILTGNNTTIDGIFALAFIAAVAFGCTCGKDLDLGNIGSNSNSTTASNSTSTGDAPFKSNGQVPSDADVQAIVKSLTADFAEAIDTNDFSDIYENSSMDFQSSYTEEQMKGEFKVFTSQKNRVVPVLEKTSSMTAEFTPAPYVRTEKGLNILVLNGKYATKPVPVNFEYEFVSRGGEWKMLKLIVKLV